MLDTDVVIITLVSIVLVGNTEIISCMLSSYIQYIYAAECETSDKVAPGCGEHDDCGTGM